MLTPVSPLPLSAWQCVGGHDGPTAAASPVGPAASGTIHPCTSGWGQQAGEPEGPRRQRSALHHLPRDQRHLDQCETRHHVFPKPLLNSVSRLTQLWCFLLWAAFSQSLVMGFFPLLQPHFMIYADKLFKILLSVEKKTSCPSVCLSGARHLPSIHPNQWRWDHLHSSKWIKNGFLSPV